MGPPVRRRIAPLPVTGPAAGDRWVYVSLAYATFALGITAGRITAAPPIAAYLIGRPEREVADYYRRRGAVFLPLV